MSASRRTTCRSVKINTKVQITVPEYPGKIFYGVVDASARAVDAQSGTTRMQLVVDNRAGELMPGAFANTRIELPPTVEALTIPSGALIFDQKGLRVATVDANSKIVLKAVTIGRDLGQVVEIATGITATDRIIDSPPDGLADGDPVRVMDTKGGKDTKKAAAAGRQYAHGWGRCVGLQSRESLSTRTTRKDRVTGSGGAPPARAWLA